VPIYEYRCPNGHSFEVFQRMDDPPPTSCETCGASPMEKVLFPIAVHFKGSGFYSTDYGSKKTKGEDGDASAPSDKPKEKAAEKSTSSDPKPKPASDSGS